MSGTVKRKLYGTLAFGAALAFASAGCIGAPERAADDDEDVAAVDQQLDSVFESGAGNDEEDDGEDTGLDDADAEGGVYADDDPEDSVTGPDPLPWHKVLAPTDDPETVSNPAPMTHGNPGTPSGGTGGK